VEATGNALSYQITDTSVQLPVANLVVYESLHYDVPTVSAVNSLER